MKQIKYILYLILTLQFTSCRENTVIVDSIKANDTTPPIIAAETDTLPSGILIGDTILLYDSLLNLKKDISSYKFDSIKIISVSDSLFKNHQSDDYCYSYKMVKIKHRDFTGFIKGTQTFFFKDSPQNKIKAELAPNLSFICTQNYGIGVADSNGLTFCSQYFYPTILKDEISKYSGVVYVKRNKLYEDRSIYFELRNDDGAYDEIIKIKKTETGYKLTIARSYQEGSAIIETDLKYEKSRYFAEIISVKKSE